MVTRNNKVSDTEMMAIRPLWNKKCNLYLHRKRATGWCWQ